MQRFQALEGHEGAVRYFTANVPIGQLEQMVRFPEDLGDLDEDQQMQRGFSRTRIRDMVAYLLEADDHFYSAVTLIILPRDLGSPAQEIDEGADEGGYAFERLPTSGPGKSRFGYLYLSGDVVLFPGDGQHRLRSAFDALKEEPELAQEELPVVLIAYQTPDQVRQLFSDLNLNAKPVSKTIGYAFERRDPLVQVVKSVSHDVPLFNGRVNRRTNSLPKTSMHVITLNTLVEGTKVIAEALRKVEDYEDLKEYVADTGTATTEITQVWEAIADAFADQWQAVLMDEPGAAGELRDEYVFPHGLGWQGLALAVSRLISEYGSHEWKEPFYRAVRSLDWRRTAEVWSGNAVIKDREKGTNRVNNTGPGVRQLADTIVERAGVPSGV
jgi:DGQHR domain-containing protein